MHWFCRRWGEDSVAPRAEWDLLVGCWRFGGGEWVLELGFGGQQRKIAGEVVSGQKVGKVFVVLGSGRGECEG